jgi:hypothetical protein
MQLTAPMAVCGEYQLLRRSGFCELHWHHKHCGGGPASDDTASSLERADIGDTKDLGVSRVPSALAVSSFLGRYGLIG